MLIDRRTDQCLLDQQKDTNAEVVMLDKLFVDDETNALKFDREVVAQGIRKLTMIFYLKPCNSSYPKHQQL